MRTWLLLIPLLLSLAGCSNSNSGLELLNVSYDPTRELWRDVNAAFIPKYEKDTGNKLTIKQSHAGSGTQARAVVDGLDADVVTLAVWSDTNQLAKKKLIPEDWDKSFPEKSLPYYSTIVFVVRKGNPKGIKDWPDLLKPDISIITPNPKTSANGKLSLLAAWGAVLGNKGTEKEAEEFVTKLYKQVPVLDTGARGSTVTFTQRKLGDVHLTWENEAHLEVAEAKGELEIIYPSLSIKAEPHVAVVDANVKRKGTEKHAKAYLDFLYTDEAQDIIAKHHYRPIKSEILKKNASEFPDIKLFPITAISPSWDEAQTRFFSDGGVFDRIFVPKGK